MLLNSRLTKLVPLALAPLVIGAAQPALAQRTNLSFETPSSEDPERPRDWKFHGSGYQPALDTTAHDGKLSLRLSRTRAGGSAGVSQTVTAEELRATRVRLSGYVRTRDATGRLLITTSVYADRTGRRYGAAIAPDVTLPVVARAVPTAEDPVVDAARRWVESQAACERSGASSPLQ